AAVVEQRVPVWRGVEHRLHGEEGAGTRPVFDYDLLAQPFRERWRDKARHLVGTAARRKTDDPAHWARWIILCGECPRRDGQQSDASELQKLSSCNDHGAISGENRDLARCTSTSVGAPLASQPACSYCARSGRWG